MAYKQGNPNLDNNFVEINAFSFRKLPVEIRTMILDCAIGGDTEMGSAIVAALRGDSKLYLEALELLNRTCVLTLAAKSNVLTPVPLQPRLSPEAKRSIQHLRLSLMSLPRLTYTKAARELNGLKTINLDVTIGDTPENSATVATNFQLTHYQQGQVMCFLKQIHSTPTNCTLTKFSITYGELNATSQSRQWFKVLMGRDAVRLREGMKVALTRSFRAGCRLEEEDDKDTFVWEAEKGEVLSWIF